MAKKRADDDAPEDEAGKKSKLPSKKVMMIGAAALVLMLGGGGGYWFFAKGKSSSDKMMAAAPGDSKASVAGGPKKPSAFLDLPEMTVNLAAGGGQSDRQQFLRMKIALEVGEQKIITDIQPMMPRIVDTFQVFMRELRPQDLEGSAGVYRLKEEMIRRVNVAVYPSRVEAVLFKELMVQ
ncbi:MAG: flagellar basal body-associated FliL family protein [Beijerinckiaceae bacterium]